MKVTRTKTSLIVWDGEKLSRDAKDQLKLGVRDASSALQATLKRIMSIPGPPASRPSVPGEPLRRRTGHARASVADEVVGDGTRRKVGFSTAVPYPAMWELRKDGKARPGLQIAFDRTVNDMERLITRRMTQGMR